MYSGANLIFFLNHREQVSLTLPINLDKCYKVLLLVLCNNYKCKYLSIHVKAVILLAQYKCAFSSLTVQRCSIFCHFYSIHVQNYYFNISNLSLLNVSRSGTGVPLKDKRAFSKHQILIQIKIYHLYQR